MLLCLLCALPLAGCRQYPHYAPVLVRTASPKAADEKAVGELELEFRFGGITEKTEPASDKPPIPVARVGMRIRNKGGKPITLTFADFSYQDHANRRFPLTAAFQSGKILEQAVLAPGQGGDFDLQFDLPVKYVFGPTFRVYWKFNRETVAVSVYTKFVVAARPIYRPEPVYYHDPWYPGPYYGYPYYYYPPYPYFGFSGFSFSYGLHYRGRQRHGHRSHH